MEFHQAVLSTLREEEINAETFAADVQKLTELAEMSEGQEDDGLEGEQGKVTACIIVKRIAYPVDGQNSLLHPQTVD